MRPEGGESHIRCLAQGAPESRVPDDWEIWDRRKNSPHFPVSGTIGHSEALTATGRARSYLCTASQDAAGTSPVAPERTGARAEAWGAVGGVWGPSVLQVSGDRTRYTG